MGRFFVSASTHKIVSTNLPTGFSTPWSSSQNITMAAFHIPVSNTTDQTILWMGTPGSAEEDILMEFTGSGVAGSKWAANLATGAAGTIAPVAHGPDGSGTTFRLHHAAVTLAGTTGTNGFGFSDGVKGTGAASTKAPTLASVAIGCSNRSIPRNFYDGYIFLPAIWNVILTDNEILRLSRGEWPGKIRPQNLVFFLPDWTNTPMTFDLAQRNPMTVTGATWKPNQHLGRNFQPPPAYDLKTMFANALAVGGGSTFISHMSMMGIS